ncbi:hypothetical protein [Leucobacter chironomi]|uniref:hypothetical protein n=1 Tax=Leucobacter chironomi TaxID=491918 RepID=UPI00042A34F0|nr:hypothetical protein [Leucobacter chironomi]
MSIAQLPARGPREGRDDRGGAAQPRRDRLTALITQLEDEHLDIAEELLADILAHQRADVRALTGAETAVLERLGVTEAEMQQPSSLPATRRSRLWERQQAERGLTVGEAAEMIGVTPARVRQRCAARTLLAQRRSDGWHLPSFQFLDGRELPGWSGVAPAIPAGTPLPLVERVLTSPAMRLRVDGEELAPFEWLAQGGDPALAAAAVDDALNRLP